MEQSHGAAEPVGGLCRGEDFDSRAGGCGQFDRHQDHHEIGGPDAGPPSHRRDHQNPGPNLHQDSAAGGGCHCPHELSGDSSHLLCGPALCGRLGPVPVHPELPVQRVCRPPVAGLQALQGGGLRGRGQLLRHRV